MAAKLGEMLVTGGAITQEQLEAALKYKSEEDRKALAVGKPRRRLGEVLIELGFTTDLKIASALAGQMHLRAIDLSRMDIKKEVLNMLDGSFMREHTVIPYKYEDGIVHLAMADPSDLKAIDDAPILIMKKNPAIANPLIEPVVAPETQINAILDRNFGNAEAQKAVEKFAKQQEAELREAVADAAKDSSPDIESAPVVSYVRSVIERAVSARASDIHIDALERYVVVRFRVDGVLAEIERQPISMLPAISTRIKIMSGLDISEKRKPQDGRITIDVSHVEYDIRVAILPTSFGEKIVMRLARANALIAKKEALGLQSYELKRFNRILTRPNGIILVTGPTGSGKSTTLYTALSELNKPEVNILTVEDPVEANIPGINQVQVNVKAGLTFATALRSFLRQDPDIIMVGEIRDGETAGIAVQASITGHLVVSTLHTNSSAASVTRLIDMGIEPYLLADSLTGIIAQRLVRRLCKDCRRWRKAEDFDLMCLDIEDAGKRTSTIPKGEHYTLDGETTLVAEEDMTMPGVWIAEPVGCRHCNGTGYLGRIGIYEVMEITPTLRNIIAKSEGTEVLEKKAKEQGLRTLHENAAGYVRSGVTSISEMNKITINAALEAEEEKKEVASLRAEQAREGVRSNV